MKRIRIIPVLLMKNGGLVKSKQFRDHRYVGDPINAVKIFNDKEADELTILDISATASASGPDINRIAEIASEAFMPLSYGGGITALEQVRQLFYYGVEKIVLNKALHTHPDLVKSIAGNFGVQSVVASIDVKKNIWGKYKVFTDNGSKNTGLDPVDFARQSELKGAGEILLNSIERDGTYKGYDTELLYQVSTAVNIPVIACGGASSLKDLKAAIEKGKASAVSAGSMFVFQRPHNAVLITYPSAAELRQYFYS